MNQAIYRSDYREAAKLFENQTQTPEGRWMVAKPLGISLLQRLQAAWLVLKGSACAVTWY